MLQSEQIKTLHIFDKFLCSLIKFINDHKKMCVATKILGNLYKLLSTISSHTDF